MPVQKISKNVNSELYLFHQNSSKLKIVKENNLNYATKAFNDFYKNDLNNFIIDIL